MQPLLNLNTAELQELGIVDWGYTETTQALSYSRYRDWLDKKQHGKLSYLTGKRSEMRASIENYYPSFKSALVFLFSYSDARNKYSSNSNLKIASYALGFEGYDYHHVLNERLNTVAQKLNLEGHRICVDTAPVLERDLAYRAGLGWFGKNSMLVSRQHGSFFMLASLLLNKTLPLKTGELKTDHCGNCTACIDACPTDAIDPQSRTINAGECISTYTIEYFKEETAPAPKNYKEGRKELFGCDICQDVCPWNISLPKETAVTQSKAPMAKKISDFFARPIKTVTYDLEQLSGKEFARRFKGTALERSGKRGLLKNLRKLAPLRPR